MAVGRISGPLLQANLERNGIDLNFKNTISDTPLLHFDVSEGKLGINKNATTDQIEVVGVTHTPAYIATTNTQIANFNTNTNNINTLTGPINLQAPLGGTINLSGLATDNIEIDENRITSYNTNSNIDLVPNGTGTTEVITNLEVFGNLHGQQNITADGNITIGSDDEDDLVLNADLATDIMPDASGTYDLGSAPKRWGQLHTNLVNGIAANAGNIIASTTNFGLRQGNIFYVSKNGNDSNVGDSVQGPMLTVKAALARADASTQGPVEIHIFPGEYEEVFPMEIPTNVSVVGHNMRSVIIKPTAGTNTNNCFLMNGETTVQHVTVKDFFSPGHAFSFATNTVVTSRSPYVQNVSVITAGSVTSASDPRGFAQGDAGKGALVDGANVLSASNEASMLFHSVTFITPGVDAITMTNGVRVEWLNSFTYFANRGLYAVRGVTGHLSTDGSTTQFGAEIRSIGSANVYGNFGAVADGADTIMYLIQHNFAYIGSGKFKDNDPSRVIQTQETSQLNTGNIYFSSTDHLGNFRIGDEFFVDLESGQSSIVITEAQVNALNGINVTTGGSTSVFDGAKATTGNLIVTNNTLFSSPGPINIDASSGQLNFLDNTNVTGNVVMSGNFAIGGTVISFGDQSSDTINFAQQFDQDIVPDISGAYSLGLVSKTWKKAWLSAAQSDDVLIQDNFITTTETNNNLELQASGTGAVRLENIVVNENNLSTDTADLELQTTTNVSITSTGSIKLPIGIDSERIALAGNLRYSTSSNNFEGYATAPISFNGVYSSDRFSNVIAHPTQNKINFTSYPTNYSTFIDADGLSAPRVTVEDIRIDGNTISTTESNSNLEMFPNGTGSTIIDDTKISSNTILYDGDGIFNFNSTGEGWYKFTETSALVVPAGKTDQRGTLLVPGDLRFNTDNDVKRLEVYAGGVDEDDNPVDWVSAVGGGESVTEELMEDNAIIFDIILG
jgi:hypothetical protein